MEINMLLDRQPKQTEEVVNENIYNAAGINVATEDFLFEESYRMMMLEHEIDVVKFKNATILAENSEAFDENRVVIKEKMDAIDEEYLAEEEKKKGKLMDSIKAWFRKVISWFSSIIRSRKSFISKNSKAISAGTGKLTGSIKTYSEADIKKVKNLVAHESADNIAPSDVDLKTLASAIAEIQSNDVMTQLNKELKNLETESKSGDAGSSLAGNKLKKVKKHVTMIKHRHAAIWSAVKKASGLGSNKEDSPESTKEATEVTPVGEGVVTPETTPETTPVEEVAPTSIIGKYLA